MVEFFFFVELHQELQHLILAQISQNLPTKSPVWITCLIKVVFCWIFFPLKNRFPIPTIHWRNLVNFRLPHRTLASHRFKVSFWVLGTLRRSSVKTSTFASLERPPFTAWNKNKSEVNGYWSNSMQHTSYYFHICIYCNSCEREPCNMSWLLVHYATSLLMYFADTFHELHQCFLLFLSPPWSLVFFLPFVGQTPKSHPCFAGSRGKEAGKHGSGLHQSSVPSKHKTENLLEPFLWKLIWNYSSHVHMAKHSVQVWQVISSCHFERKENINNLFLTTCPLCDWKMLSGEVASDMTKLPRLIASWCYPEAFRRPFMSYTLHVSLS